MAYSSITKPEDYFNTVLYTGDLQDSDGTGHTQSITGVGFPPDWVWHKGRSGARTHMIVDRVRGVSSYNWLASNSTGVEITTNTNGAISSIDSDSITVQNGNDSSSKSNNAGKNGETWVFWNWLSGGSAPAITYSVKVVSDSGNKYRFDDFGTSAVTLDLQEGGTYTFDGSDSSMSSHPIKLSTTSGGTHSGGSSYNTGVTYQLDGSTVSESAYVSGYSAASSRKLIITVAASAPTLYYYCHYHSGMGGQANTNSTFGSSNFSGSIQSTVSANTTAGFSIVKIAKSNTNVATIGHGLSATPKFIIGKDLDTADNWTCYHESIGNDKGIYLNATNAEISASTFWDSTSPTSSVFTIGSDNTWNSPSILYYCFAEKKGYSKIGSYTGNGSTDGTFVNTGFAPAFVLTKCTSHAGENWNINDNKRPGSNVIQNALLPDSNAAEVTASFQALDIVSNGFKWRGTNDRVNASAKTYIYMAFAENPFVGNDSGTAVPVTAR